MSSALKVDKFGDDMFKNLNGNYVKMNHIDFVQWCCDAVDTNSISSKEKKNTFKLSLKKCKNKDQVITKVTNFFLAGEGLKVV